MPNVDFNQGVCLYCPDLITLAPVARDKERFTQSHMNMYEIMIAGYPTEPEWNLPVVQMSSFSMTGDFYTSHFADFVWVKIDPTY